LDTFTRKTKIVAWTPEEAQSSKLHKKKVEEGKMIGRDEEKMPKSQEDARADSRAAR